MMICKHPNENNANHKVWASKPEEKLRVVAEIVGSDLNRFDRETREKLSFIQVRNDRREESPSRLDRLDPINELSSTASFLDEVSFDRTEEDLDFSPPRASRQWKKRKSGDRDGSASKKRRSKSRTRKVKIKFYNKLLLTSSVVFRCKCVAVVVGGAFKRIAVLQ
ncbi:hypothetical protein QYM36_003141, partial [Artemia franciscana]